MKFSITEYRSGVEAFRREILAVDPGLAGIKLSGDSWSLMEIVGHLIDSAANNHQRFVRLQMGDLENFPGYEAEDWVRIQNYRTADWQKTAELWYLLNNHLLHIIGNIGSESLDRIWTLEGQTLSLGWLVTDYFRHLEHHIDHFRRRLEEVRAAAGEKP
jgi:hypothetical protein